MLELLSKSITIFKVSGIPVKLNISLILLYFLLLPGHSLLGAFLVFFSIVTCVIIHELAHSLTAKSYGIPTEDIIIFFFGGVARIHGLGNSNREEFFITAAGPLSNLVMALLVFFFAGVNFPENGGVDFWTWVFIVNIMMGLFNLIPAFPMDGGRLLRVALRSLGFKSANLITYRVSRIICIAFFILALLYQLIGLMVISVLIFLAAPQELLPKRK